MHGMHSYLNCNCNCNICDSASEVHSTTCSASSMVYKRISQLWEECVCKKGEYDQWHKLECVMGTCNECGIEKLPLCPAEVSASGGYLLRWKCFRYEEVGKTMDGKPRKRIKETFMETSPSVFLDYMRPKIKEFIKHSFVASWQDDACKEMMVLVLT